MKLQDILKKSILSEKAYKQMDKGVYSFLVDRRATKKEIEKAIKNQFSVEVQKINIAKVAHKSKRVANTRKQVKTGGGKKAIVQLAPGQTIAMLSPKTKEKSKQKKEKEVEKVSAEVKGG